MDAREDLRACRYFSELTDEALDSLAAVLDKRIIDPHINNGTIIKAFDKNDRSIYFLTSGAVNIVSQDKLGKSVHYGVQVTAPAIFGEVAFFSKDGQRTATVQALESCDVYVLRPERLDDFVAAFPGGLELFCRHMADTIARSDRILRSRLAAPPKLDPPDAFIRAISNVGFLMVNAVFIGIWCWYNVTHDSVDAFPFNFLAFLLSIEGLVITTFVLNRQTRAAHNAEALDMIHNEVTDLTKANTESLLREFAELRAELAELRERSP